MHEYLFDGKFALSVMQTHTFCIEDPIGQNRAMLCMFMRSTLLAGHPLMPTGIFCNDYLFSFFLSAHSNGLRCGMLHVYAMYFIVPIPSLRTNSNVQGFFSVIGGFNVE